MKKNIYLSSAFALLFGMAVQAQVKDKNMGTEEVRVVKSYDATVIDAFKIKDNPLMDDEDNNVKREIKYAIFSFPVASTFAPEKGQAATVDKDTLNTVFNNYALLGYGNYNTIRGELGIAEKVSKDIYVVGLLNHISSQGGISGLLVDDKYSKSNLDFNVGSKKIKNDWNVNFGISQQKYNWYGLPSNVFAFSPLSYQDRDFDQKYNDAHIGFKYDNNGGAFRGVSLSYKYFSDDYDSRESRFLVNPKFDVELENTTIKVDIKADYLNTEFADRLLDGARNKYSYLILGAEPSVRFTSDDYSVQLGFGVANISGSANDKNDNSIVVYPKIKANYDLVKNIVVAYAGAEGGVTNNSYANFVEQNPFVSPDLQLMPTKQQFNFYVGLKGKLDHNVSYNVRASYLSEENKAMFVNNRVAQDLLKSEVYQYGNSFSVIYDQVETFNFFGELNLNFSNDITIDLSGELNSYSADKKNVYNLPELKVGAKINVNFTDQWFGGLNMYYVGQRKDIGLISVENDLQYETVTVKSYVDLNLNVGYKADKNWTIFAKGNNIFNQSYNNWNNYKVQGTQVLVGAMYKFNFKN